MGFKKETAADAFRRYESLKKSNVSAELLNKVLTIATELMNEQLGRTVRRLDVQFIGADWWETVKKMYKITEQDNQWVIISNARDWIETKEWHYPTKFGALEQLEKLITYKANDRRRGHGDVEKDFERVEALKATS